MFKDVFFFNKPHPKFTLLSSNLHFSHATVPIPPSSTQAKYTKSLTGTKKKIYPFCKMGNLDKVIEPLYMSPKSEIELRTCCSILQLCAELESLQDGKKVHSCIYAGNLLGI
jgi:hypothetical protein